MSHREQCLLGWELEVKSGDEGGAALELGVPLQSAPPASPRAARSQAEVQNQGA